MEHSVERSAERRKRDLFRRKVVCSRMGKGENIMLEIVAIVLVVLWVLGMVSSTTMGGLIHVLLAIALVVVLIRVIQGRRVI